MALDDLYRCGMPGHTSKLRDPIGGAQATAISTYGFRGEAIACLSHFCSLEIVTVSRRDPSSAFSKVVREGASAGMSRSIGRSEPGTTITCTNLFHNRPVVRKALLLTPSSWQSELAKIEGCLRSIAIVNPSACITLQAADTGAVLLSTVRYPTVLHAFSNILSGRSASGLRSIEAEGDGGLCISAILSSPAEPCRSRDLQLLFVNGRPCRCASRAPISIPTSRRQGHFPDVAGTQTMRDP